MNNISKSIIINHIDDNTFKEIKMVTSDINYFHLVTTITNGGYFFNNSLHIYGYNTSRYHDIININNVLSNEYGSIYDGLHSFGEDIFGNQFTFSSEGIIFFNIETGDREILGETFSDWLQVLDSNTSYYTGNKFGKYLSNPIGNRLCPKTPFIIGGEYDIKNLYSLKFPSYIQVNANIANQIFHLPNGTQIKLKSED